MADIRRGIGADNRVERLPWLEPVEDEDDYVEEGGGRRWAVLGAALLAAMVLIVAGATAFRHWHAGRADMGGIIRAPATPYKVKPANAGGLAADTSGVVAEQTGTGADIDAPLALVAPEQPIVGPGSQPAAAPAPGATAPGATAPAAPAPRTATVIVPPPPAPTAPVAGTAPPPAATGGGIVQLGAFSTEAKAKAAWKNLSKRFSYLQPMAVSITSAASGDATVYRLRASGGEPAAQLCARLQLAGEACAVVG